MIGKNGSLPTFLTAAALLLGAGTQLASACPVCFGDPEAPLVQAAGRGMLVMLGFIGFVLISVATIGGCWIVRAHRLNAADKNGPKSLFLSE